MWAATRIVLELIGAASYRLDGQQVPWLHMWIRWDAGYYLDVARHGYRLPILSTGTENGQSGLNFFPLLPIGTFVVGRVVGSIAAGGLIFANLCLIAAATFLHRLAGLHGRQEADWSVLSLMSLPGSFALSGVMSEAPFLAFSTMAAWFAVRGRPAAVAASVSLLAITRLTGLFQVAGLTVDWAIGRWRGEPASLRTIFLLALSGLPLLVYAGWMYHVTGDALVAIHSHYAFWDQRSGVPFQDFFLFAWGNGPNLVVQSVVALAMLVLLIACWRSFTVGEWVFLALSIETSSSSLALAPSLIRYMIVLYPLHLAVGRLSSRHLAGRVMLVGMTMTNAALFLPWLHGRDVYR